MRHTSFRRAALCIAAVLTSSAAITAALAPDSAADAAQTRPATNMPSLQMVEDDPKLPRVLLIGDSISMGYTLRARKELDGIANVHRPLTNCGSTARGLTEMSKWLATFNTGGEPAKQWDVIHFNFGLHDLKYVNSRGGTVTPADGHQNVPPETYEKNLRTLIKQMQATGATLVWASTTPVQEGMPGHLTADVIKYNTIAEHVMKENGIAIDDLYSLVLPREQELQLPANVHFKGSGSDVMAAQVKASIAEALAKRQSK